MDYQSAFAISAAGMSAETAGGRGRPESGQRQYTAVGQGRGISTAAGDVVGARDGCRPWFRRHGRTRLICGPGPERGAVPGASPARLRARHPQADKDGYVSYPGVDTLTEMMALMVASRAYEADVAAFNAAKSMAMKALEIGGRQ